MRKHRKSEATDAKVSVGGSSDRKRGLFKGKWALVAAFMVVFGGSGSALLYASHADTPTPAVTYTSMASYWNLYCPTATAQCAKYQMGIVRAYYEADKSTKYYAWAELESTTDTNGKTNGSLKVLRTEVERLDFGVPNKAFTAITAVNSGNGSIDPTTKVQGPPPPVTASTGAGAISTADLGSMGARLTLAVRYSDNSLLEYTTGLLVNGQTRAGVTVSPLPTPSNAAFTVTTPPTSTPTTKAPTPTPTPSKTPTPPTDSGSGSPAASTVVDYGSKTNDGCGGQATHYNYVTKNGQKVRVHVGPTNDGTGSVCVCSNGHTFQYANFIGDSSKSPCSSTTTLGGGNPLPITAGDDGCGQNGYAVGAVGSSTGCQCSSHSNNRDHRYTRAGKGRSDREPSCDQSPPAASCSASRPITNGKICTAGRDINHVTCTYGTVQYVGKNGDIAKCPAKLTGSGSGVVTRNSTTCTSKGWQVVGTLCKNPYPDYGNGAVVQSYKCVGVPHRVGVGINSYMECAIEYQG